MDYGFVGSKRVSMSTIREVVIQKKVVDKECFEKKKKCH